MIEVQLNKVYSINENDFIFTTKQAKDILADDNNTKKSEVCFFFLFLKTNGFFSVLFRVLIQMIVILVQMLVFVFLISHFPCYGFP